jgi:hypothetical protein
MTENRQPRPRRGMFARAFRWQPRTHLQGWLLGVLGALITVVGLVVLQRATNPKLPIPHGFLLFWFVCFTLSQGFVQSYGIRRRRRQAARVREARRG